MFLEAVISHCVYGILDNNNAFMFLKFMMTVFGLWQWIQVLPIFTLVLFIIILNLTINIIMISIVLFQVLEVLIMNRRARWVSFCNRFGIIHFNTCVYGAKPCCKGIFFFFIQKVFRLLFTYMA